MPLIDYTLDGRIDKVAKAVRLIRVLDPTKKGEPPYYVAYSGGKDGDAIRILCELAGVSYELYHHHTTVDAPETVRYVRTVPGVNIVYPTISMWRLIPHKKMPPTNAVRYCCSFYKEHGGKGRFVMTGVRRSESRKRALTRGEVEIPGKGRPKAVFNMDNDESRRLIENCNITGKLVINPIVDWGEDDVWELLLFYRCQSNPLYADGIPRIGCIGCPKSGNRRWDEFRRWPVYQENYIRAFDRMLIVRRNAGLKTEWTSGEQVFSWWMNPRNANAQIDGQLELEHWIAKRMLARERG